ATLRINQEGLVALFNEVYAASKEEVEEAKPRKVKGSDEIIPPLRESVKQVAKRGKSESKVYYVYPAYVPKGAFLVDLDPTANGDKGDWIKLWRDVIWRIFRGVPATRKPFEDRA